MRRLTFSALFTLAVLSFSFLFDHGLWTPDEPRDAEIAREIGFSAVPTLNQVPFLEKPPLFFWTGAAAYKIFGVSAWSARLPSMLFAWGTWFFTFLLARRMFAAEMALDAVLILATMVMFFDISHKSTVDNALVFFTTGVFYWLYRGYRAERNKLAYYSIAYLFALGVFMSKGLVGLALTAPAFVLFSVWQKNYRELLRAQPWLAILLIGAGAMLWLMHLTPELQRAWLIDNHLGRFTGKFATSGHNKPFYYYGIAWAYAFAPWTLALIPALVWAVKPVGSIDTTDKRFLLSWLIAGMLILSLASTKREIYLLPLLPAAAILIAAWFARVSEAPKWATVFLYGFVVLLALSQITIWLLAVGLHNWFALAVTIGIAAGAAVMIVWTGRFWPFGLSLAMAAVLVGGFLVVVPVLEKSKNFEAFARQLPPLERIPALNPDETTLAIIPFYTGRWVEPVKAPGSQYLVVTLKRRNAKPPDGYEVLAKLDPEPVEVFGFRLRLSDRSMYLLKRSG